MISTEGSAATIPGRGVCQQRRGRLWRDVLGGMPVPQYEEGQPGKAERVFPVQRGNRSGGVLAAALLVMLVL